MAEDKQVRKIREKLEKHLESNRNEEAVKLLAELMKLEPKNVRWPHKRGDLLRKQGQNKDAIMCYEAAAGIYADQGFIARAVAMAKTVLNLDPSRIDILERIDPVAALQLTKQARPGVFGSAETPPKRHPMVMDGAAPIATTAARHPMVMDDRPPPTAARHPMVMDDHPPPTAAAPTASAPPPTSQQGGGDRYPDLRRPPAAPAAAAAKSPPVPPQQAVAKRVPAPPPRPAKPAPRKRPITLDRLSLPSPVRQLPAAAPDALPAPPRVPDAAEIYSQALGGLDELQVDPSAAPNETRFSDAPPRHGVEVAITEAELEAREAVPEVESARPEPPSASKLSKLPLFPLFAEVPKDALAEMIAGTDLVELEHGEYVIRKGDPGDALYGIIEGSVSISVPGQQIKVTLAEGDVFGESCLLQDEKRHADVIAEGKLVALRVPREVLTRLLGRHPRLAEVLLELLTRRLLGNMLQSAPLFQEFDAAGRRDLARLFEIRRAAAGTLLAAAGKKMDGLYISLTGTLSVSQPGGPERIAPPGSMFGQHTLLSNEASQVNVKTRVHMVVLRLPAAAFTRVAMQYPAILARLSELAASDVVKITT